MPLVVAMVGPEHRPQAGPDLVTEELAATHRQKVGWLNVSGRGAADQSPGEIVKLTV
ncbi:MAG: hypothetical protein ACYC3X_16040 [Pirellulaceae bacterium]